MRDKIREKFSVTTDDGFVSPETVSKVMTIPTSPQTSPIRLITRRMGYAIGLILLVAGIVYLDRRGYSEQNMSFVDALYYATVSLSTTGYGDITPVTQGARLMNIILVTPARIIFLALLVGTTLSVLTEESRKTIQIRRWRKTMRNHTIVVGYGTKGRAAINTMLADGVLISDIVVIDNNPKVLLDAQAKGLVTVQGSATHSDILQMAGVQHASSVVVATDSDDTSILVTLSVREMSTRATIVSSIREGDNAHLLKQSGADTVVVSADTAGRLLGLATITPSVVEITEDLLSPDEGFSVAERTVTEAEVGGNPRNLADIVLGIVRSGKLYHLDSPEIETVEPADRLLYVKHVRPERKPHAETERGETGGHTLGH